PAGIAPVAVAPALWESVDPTSVEGWYLNLFTWDRYEREWGDWHPTPTTISSNLFYAFHRALTLLRKEGLEARVARHAKVAAKLRAGLIDLRSMAPDPAGGDRSRMQKFLREPVGARKEFPDSVKRAGPYLIAGSSLVVGLLWYVIAPIPNILSWAYWVSAVVWFFVMWWWL